MVDIGSKIKYYRKLNNLTQSELGLILHKSLRTIQKYEAGEIIPSMLELLRLSEILNINITNFIYEDKKENMENKKEMIDHPAHYNRGKYECIDVIEDWKLNFNLGNTTKYIHRAGHKDKDKAIEDLKKARWYLDREIETQEKNRL